MYCRLGRLGKIEFTKQLFMKDQNSEFLEWNRKISKIREDHFVEGLSLRRLSFLDCCFFQTEHSSCLEVFAVC